MATASNPTPPPPPHHSPRPRRSSVPRAADSAPWTSDFDAPVVVVSDNREQIEKCSEVEGSVKAVWKTPSPAPADVAPEVSPLIGVAVWPALSESTKASPKLSPSDSAKNPTQGSSSVPQLTGISSSSTTQRQGNNTNPNPSTQMNHTVPTRQRSFRRGNGGGSGNPSNNMTANGGLSPAPASQGYGVESVPNNTGRPANPESLAEANPHREAGGQRGGFVPQSSSGGEHQQRNSYRRGSGGPHPRGDGSHYHNGRRDQDSGNQDRIPHRNFGGRGGHMQPQRGSSRPFIRGPPHTNTSYVPPPPIAVHPSFGTPMVYPSPEVYYFPGPLQDPYRAGSMVPPMGPVFYPFFDPLLHTKIVNQIEFYFSTENLVRDTYLRKNMDEQGWVSVKLIAGFQKVSQLTDNIQLILAALQASRLLEIEAEKIRLRDDWQRWIIPPPVQQIDASSSQSIQESGQEMLAVHLQNVALDERSVKM